MSNLKVDTINDANGGSAAVLYGVASPPNSMGFRNRIINGDMRIDQRNAGAALVPAPVNQCMVDRLLYSASQTGKYNFQQNAFAGTGPEGFPNYAGFVVASAYSSTASDFFAASQRIEGFNISDFGWGTSAAKTVTLSFWVQSSLTGLHSGGLVNGSFNRSYPYSFTVSAANTWEFKTITVPGDTSGTWSTTNGMGMGVVFNLGCGSDRLGTANAWVGSEKLGVTGAVSVVGTSGATFYITGVQLEAGSVASPFERRDYGRELMMCQRYYYRISTSGATYQSFGLASPYNATQMRLDTIFPVTMRTAPAALDASAASSFLYEKEAGYAVSPSAIILGSQTSAFIGVSVGTTSAITAGGAVYHTYSNGTPAYLGFSAEL